MEARFEFDHKDIEKILTDKVKEMIGIDSFANAVATLPSVITFKCDRGIPAVCIIVRK